MNQYFKRKIITPSCIFQGQEAKKVYYNEDDEKSKDIITYEQKQQSNSSINPINLNQNLNLQTNDFEDIFKGDDPINPIDQVDDPITPNDQVGDPISINQDEPDKDTFIHQSQQTIINNEKIKLTIKEFLYPSEQQNSQKTDKEFMIPFQSKLDVYCKDYQYDFQKHPKQIYITLMKEKNLRILQSREQYLNNQKQGDTRNELEFIELQESVGYDEEDYKVLIQDPDSYVKWTSQEDELLIQIKTKDDGILKLLQRYKKSDLRIKKRLNYLNIEFPFQFP